MNNFNLAIIVFFFLFSSFLLLSRKWLTKEKKYNRFYKSLREINNLFSDKELGFYFIISTLYLISLAI